MRVLLTGAFGNLGQATLKELLAEGHRVRCFDLGTAGSRQVARSCPAGVEVMWGDLRRPDDVTRAVAGQESVVHLGFILPSLAINGQGTEDCPDLAHQVNVGGTQNLLQAMEAAPDRPRLVFASSMAVFGRTQDQPPPRTATDPVCPEDHYTRHKVTCEQMIRASSLRWTILRLAAALPMRLLVDRAMFDVPLDNRIEFIHRQDAALAIARAPGNAEVWGQTLLIGGGPRCQFLYRDFVRQVLEASGIGMLPDAAFTETPFCTDWLDTGPSQKLLRYQNHTLDHYTAELVQMLGVRRGLIRMVRPAVRAWLLWQSPHWRRNQGASRRAARGAAA